MSNDVREAMMMMMIVPNKKVSYFDLFFLLPTNHNELKSILKANYHAFMHMSFQGIFVNCYIMIFGEIDESQLQTKKDLKAKLFQVATFFGNSRAT